MELFLAEIILLSFSFPPKGTALCNGQLLPISQNQALFSLLGTTYGGDGQTTFALPNLQGRSIAHEGNGFNMGNQLGAESVSLSVTNLPVHNHSFSVSKNIPTLPTPGSTSSLAQGPPEGSGPNFHPANLFTPVAPSPANYLAPASISNYQGGGQAFSVIQPYLVLNYCIGLQGIFPARN